MTPAQYIRARAERPISRILCPQNS